MRLGIGSYSFGWAVQERTLSALQIVDLAVEWQVHLVQLCNNLPPETFEGDALKKLRDHARQKKVAIEFGTAGSQPDHLRKMLEVAKELSSPILRVVVDTANDKPSTEQVVARLREVQPDLRSAGITLAIENHDRFPCDSLAWIVGNLQSDHVGVCLDTVNSMGVPEGPRQVVSALGPYVVNLHLKDFAIHRVPSMQGFTVEGRPAGEGMLNIPWLLDELGRYGKTQSAIIETWTPPEPKMDATIAREFEWARRSVTNVRKWITQ